MKKLLGVSNLFFVAMISSVESQPPRQEEEENEMVVGGSIDLLADLRKKMMAATVTISFEQKPQTENQSNSRDKKK